MFVETLWCPCQRFEHHNAMPHHTLKSVAGKRVIILIIVFTRGGLEWAVVMLSVIFYAPRLYVPNPEPGRGDRGERTKVGCEAPRSEKNIEDENRATTTTSTAGRRNERRPHMSSNTRSLNHSSHSAVSTRKHTLLAIEKKHSWTRR